MFPGRMPMMFRPSSAIVPWNGVTPPAIAASVVDLPAPLGPMMQTISPSATVSETPRQRHEFAIANMDVIDFDHRAHHASMPR